MILRIGGIKCSKPYIVLRASPVSQRDGVRNGRDGEGVSLHHLPLASLRRAIARTVSCSDSAPGRTRCVLSVHDRRARLGASDRYHRAKRATHAPEIHGRQNAQANAAGRCHKYLRPAARELGIETRFGWYTFRHTYSTLLRSVGTEFKVMQELLRHSTMRSTLDVYTQAITPAKQNAQAAVMSLILSSQ
jgi:hypothetical protein